MECYQHFSPLNPIIPFTEPIKLSTISIFVQPALNWRNACRWYSRTWKCWMVVIKARVQQQRWKSDKKGFTSGCMLSWEGEDRSVPSRSTAHSKVSDYSPAAAVSTCLRVNVSASDYFGKTSLQFIALKFTAKCGRRKGSALLPRCGPSRLFTKLKELILSVVCQLL